MKDRTVNLSLYLRQVVGRYPSFVHLLLQASRTNKGAV